MKLILAIFSCLLISACTCQCPEPVPFDWKIPEAPLLEEVTFQETTDINGRGIIAVTAEDKLKIDQNTKRLELHIDLLEQAIKFAGEVY
jgi:hypothetical protein